MFTRAETTSTVRTTSYASAFLPLLLFCVTNDDGTLKSYAPFPFEPKIRVFRTCEKYKVHYVSVAGFPSGGGDSNDLKHIIRQLLTRKNKSRRLLLTFCMNIINLHLKRNIRKYLNRIQFAIEFILLDNGSVRF